MFDNFLDMLFTSFSAQECLDAINDEKEVEARWDKYVDDYLSSSRMSDYGDDDDSIRSQWDYNQLSKHCETLMRVKMENLSIDELLNFLECGEQVMDYADKDTKNVYAAWQLQQKLIESLNEKKESKSMKI